MLILSLWKGEEALRLKQKALHTGRRLRGKSVPTVHRFTQDGASGDKVSSHGAPVHTGQHFS